MDIKKIRLQKYLSEAGIASRRAAEELIKAGKVRVNGIVAGIGDKISKKDKVLVSGKPVENKSKKLYIMLHKPRGFVTTMNDEMDRKCVAMLVKDVGERVYPIGRLDKNSEGLLLFTNDGEFANMMMHPKSQIGKTYRVTLKTKVTEDQIAKLTAGVVIDGQKTLPAKVTELSKEDGRTVLQIIIFEGRNRQIRYMCEAVGLTVSRLKRTAVGEIKLGMLPQGKWRELNEKEIRNLYSAGKRKING